MTKPSTDKAGFRPADESGIPVPSRYLLIEFLQQSGKPSEFDLICAHFGLKSVEAQNSLAGRLQRMCHQGTMVIDRKERYALADKIDAFTGRVIGHAKGFGFVRPDQGGDDVYLHRGQMRKVLHGDRVLVKVKNVNARGQKEGVIIEVLVEPDREIVGHYYNESGIGFVTPDDARVTTDILIPAEQSGNAQAGDIVVVKITKHPVQHPHAVGMICHILGNELAPGMETDIAIRKHEIPNQWPESVEKSLIKNHKKFTTAGAGKGRVDIRDLPLVTIDGEDARDFDDAVFCQPNRRGFRLVVAIADVSHYVGVDSALDQEAVIRGNSVYFPNRVVPMLPELLSNGICSLNPMEDRCCMVCDMQISRTGKTLEYRFYPGLMHSKARLTYTTVARIIEEKDEQTRASWQHVVKQLDDLNKLFVVLNNQRLKRGTINFEFPEPRFYFDKDQRIEKVGVLERNMAHRLIEECMLCANVCAGELLQKHYGDGGIYRNHEGPSPEKLEDLRSFLKGLGLHLQGDESPTAADYATLLSQVVHRPQIVNVVQSILLRSLSQAVYSCDEIGHFALAYPIYTHFTSPIRRYPDLVVHRLIRNVIEGKTDKVAPSGMSVGEVGEQCCFTERRAEDASRDVIAWLKAEFMQDRIGEEFDGVISAVKEFGIFVQLNELFIDGLVHVTALGRDYFHYDPVQLQLIGERNGRRFGLGDKVKIVVTKVNLDQAKIDFELAENKTASGKTPSNRKTKDKIEPRRKKTKKTGKPFSTKEKKDSQGKNKKSKTKAKSKPAGSKKQKKTGKKKTIKSAKAGSKNIRSKKTGTKN